MKRNAQLLYAIGALAFLSMPARSGLAFPWSIDMYRGPQVAPLAAAPRVMPEGTVPVEGSEPKTSREAASTLRSPIELTPDALAEGKTLYETDCAACHGAFGRGDGTVVKVLRVPPPDLVSSAAVARADGYIYGVVRDGLPNMPALADALSPRERWEVVLYVRTLQGGERKAGAK